MACKKMELYRSRKRAKIAGVCAGVADYFGIETWLVRILVVSGVLFGMPFIVLAYIAAWFILDKAPQNKRQSAKNNSVSPHESNEVSGERDVTNESIKVKGKIWQAGEPPKQALYDINRKFQALENKLQHMEQHVTSAEFTVSREINKL